MPNHRKSKANWKQQDQEYRTKIKAIRQRKKQNRTTHDALLSQATIFGNRCARREPLFTPEDRDYSRVWDFGHAQLKQVNADLASASAREMIQ